MIYISSGDCSNCDCHQDRHSFRTSYQVKEKVSIIKYVDKNRENKYKKEIRGKIEQNKNDLNLCIKKIHSCLLSGIDCLYGLSKINDEMNRI